MSSLSRLSSLLLGAITSFSAMATDDLMDIYQKSLNHDPSWAAIVQEYEANREVELQGRAELLPTISADASTSKNHNHLKGVQDQTYDSSQAGASIEQPLIKVDGVYTYRRAKALVEQADAKFASDLQNFILKVASAYFGVLRAEDTLTFTKADEEAIAQQLEQAQERFDVGLIPITDVYEAQAAHDLARVNVIVAENDLSIAKEDLETLTGEAHHTVNPLMEKFPIGLPQPTSMKDWEEKALAQNYAILQAMHGKKAAKHEIRIQRNARSPVLDAFATYSYTDSDEERTLGTGGTGTAPVELITYGLRVDWPIFSGGAISSRTREASYRYESSKEQFENAQKLTIQETRNFYRTVVADVSTVGARQQGIRSANSALDATMAGYDVGTRNIVDVLNAQQALFAAKRDYANARYDYVLNWLSLQSLVGELTETNLEELNKWLPPAEQQKSKTKSQSKNKKKS